MSFSTFRRRLRRLNLTRRLHGSSPIDVWNTVCVELQGPGRLCGYRSMYRLLRQKHNLNVTQDMVRNILRQIDPVSVTNRQRHTLRRRTYVSNGPNDTWHIDGYDKLRPYGILISGCIDGYSRKIIWLKASYSNHSPGLIAKYFLDSTSALGGFPSRVRTDCGTENVTVAAIQSTVTGNLRSHIYGTSPGNQRIESWWSFFRRSRSQWWIELFESLREFDAFHPGNLMETECLRFCCMHIIQMDLDEVRRQWNTHRIRPSVGARCPPGIPDELYYLPRAPAVDCSLRGNMVLPQEIFDQLQEPGLCEDPVREDYFQYLCHFHNWVLPADTNSATELYFKLLPYIH